MTLRSPRQWNWFRIGFVVAVGIALAVLAAAPTPPCVSGVCG